MSSLSELREVVARLRRECPWDRAQTLSSARPYLVEEVYEALHAVDAGDRDQLAEELGDLLFQVYFLAILAELDIEDVAAGIVRKMVERHPHVYGGEAADAASGGIAAWEARKAARRGGSRLDGVPVALPSLVRAHRVAEKASAVGFDWPDVGGVLAKVDEERTELAQALATGDPAAVEHEYGDLLLACANLGRFLGVAAEDALRGANARFERRFRGVEARAAAAGVRVEDAGMARLDAWWDEAKQDE